MDNEQIKKMIDDPGFYDDSKEYTLRSMIGDFYNRKMLSVVLLVWADTLLFISLAIFSGIKFFKVDQARDQLMYAVIFICSIQFIVLMKILAWQMIQRNGIKREIKKLELRIEELNETVNSK
ncbi:MAG: DUF6768 family protein [Planctomycetota bacterium]|jgi:hypothetical protein